MGVDIDLRRRNVVFLGSRDKGGVGWLVSYTRWWLLPGDGVVRSKEIGRKNSFGIVDFEKELRVGDPGGGKPEENKDHCVHWHGDYPELGHEPKAEYSALREDADTLVSTVTGIESSVVTC